MTLIDRQKTGCEHCGSEAHNAEDLRACRDEAINRLAAAHRALAIACTLLQRASAELRTTSSDLPDEIDKALGPVPT